MLGSNAIGDDGAVALAEALKINKALTSVNVSTNKIGGVGMAARTYLFAVSSVGCRRAELISSRLHV